MRLDSAVRLPGTRIRILRRVIAFPQFRILGSREIPTARSSLLATLVLLPWLINHSAMAADIGGRWLTFDSESGSMRSMIEITRTNDSIQGRIIELFLQPGEPQNPKCDLCSGAQKGKPLRGMEILLLRPTGDGGGYAGTILDPEEGRLYKCVVTLKSDGKRLSIRGYIGIPALGRSVAWSRVE